MEVILDTSFILTCIKQKIDFFEELQNMGLKILIPKQVIVELKGVDKSGFSLELLKGKKFGRIDLNTKNVDEGIIEYAKDNFDIFVATLDRDIKKKTMNSNIVIREKSRLEII